LTEGQGSGVPNLTALIGHTLKTGKLVYRKRSQILQILQLTTFCLESFW